MGARSQRGIAVALACALALAACFADERPAVQTERATSGVVTETVTAPARVDASARQDVAAALSGVVIALEVDDGEHVDEGQVVVRLESTQVDLAREQAEAAQQAARQAGGIQVDGQGGATVETVERAVADLDEEIRPRIERARAEAEEIEDETQRTAALAAVDAVETSYLTTRAGLLATGAAIASQQDAVARSLAGALNQAIAQATAAQRAQAQAAARAAEAQADDLALAAPFSGTVQLGEAAATDGIILPGEVPPELAGLAGPFGAVPEGGGGTLQIGIGSIGDAVAHALILRHRQPDVFRAALAALVAPQALDHRQRELAPFSEGLYGNSEMLVDGFIDLYRAGIVRRRAWLLVLPVADLVASYFRRIIRGRSPFSADREHFHHFLQRRGMSVTGSVILVLSLLVVCGGIGYAGWRLGWPEPALFFGLMLVFAGQYVTAHFTREE